VRADLARPSARRVDRPDALRADRSAVELGIGSSTGIGSSAGTPATGNERCSVGPRLGDKGQHPIAAALAGELLDRTGQVGERQWVELTASEPQHGDQRTIVMLVGEEQPQRRRVEDRSCARRPAAGTPKRPARLADEQPFDPVALANPRQPGARTTPRGGDKSADRAVQGDEGPTADDARR
jgi:hypothetical protein